MANKIYPYDIPGDFSYDANVIEVSGGLAKLKSLIPANETFYASYDVDINGTRGAGVLTGTAYAGASVSGGKLDCKTYGKLVDYDAIGNANSQQQGCIRFLITPNFSGIGQKHRFFTITKEHGSYINNIRIMQWHNGQMSIVINDKDAVSIANGFLPVWNPVQGQEYEFELNWDITLGETRFFIDGVQLGATISGTGIRDSNIELLRIGADTILTSDSNSEFNNVQIFSTVQHTANYTPCPCPDWPYCSLKPTIKPASLWDVPALYAWFGFLETLGGDNAGSVAYQLSDDGVNWKYWNGVVWDTAGINYNSASVINSNMASFPTTEKKLTYKAFLISDGEQQVEIDTTTIIANEETPSSVYAGIDKSCLIEETFKAFSDVVISDVDGDIENATAWYDIEGSGYIQILKNGWGTLQDAIRNFQYQFNNLGNVTCTLKIIDEQSLETTDSLVTTVSNVTVTFNVRDKDGNHMSDIEFTAGDGTATQTKSSPFTYDYGHIATYFTATFNKTGYSTAMAQVASTEHIENVVMASEVTVSYPITITIDGVACASGGTLEDIVKGDSIDFTCTITDTDISGWKLRCEIYDSGDNSIKLATANSGGSDLQIEVTDATTGKFIIHVAKAATINFKDTARIEIECEITAEKLITCYQSVIAFNRNKITWTTPS